MRRRFPAVKRWNARGCRILRLRPRFCGSAPGGMPHRDCVTAEDWVFCLNPGHRCRKFAQSRRPSVCRARDLTAQRG
ncbi:hypothetical protein GDI2268 [Gluconacetobacter diazotrophicus PA1 5]|uniref:Uncharacterized protein n=1 Tax=Gluconacetobacter diazotrophicus (strain ATCC 49037 / DSM 5601 / CCUG 37298 / CIP 103539 / LMG 7603 / PAl5) TaxID=272568 RepID=A9HLT9_GLUDA|nr:hypothetical protein GDI2268 [Gluconacetobacter diazotrophicus PA1 5]